MGTYYIHPIDPCYFPRITYDESPAHVNRLVHAIDFVVPEGTPIRASRDGLVRELKHDSDEGGLEQEFDENGNFIELAHEDGEFSIYEHIQQYSCQVGVGEKVSAGQIIAYSGSTGWLAHLGPHLHFDVHRYFGEGVDDYEAIPIRWTEDFL